jgi:gluconolactonase
MPRGFIVKSLSPWFPTLAILLGLTMTVTTSAETPKTIGEIERLDPAFDKIVAPGAKIEVLADGFDWAEGPCWIPKDGCLLFSDIPPNKIMKWDPKSGISLFKERVGYTGKEPFTGPEPGTNGITLDSEGRIVCCCHGDRAIKRFEKDGTITVLASKYEGKRLNSPNDLVYRSNGDLYFTDPPYGLPEREKDPARELDWFGVYRLSQDGKLTLLTKELTRPNGLAFSPDEKILYVAQSDPEAAVVKTFPVKADGTLGQSKLFFDATKWVKDRPGLPDGLKVDKAGRVWATGPGGIYCFSPDGKILGRLSTGERTANCTFGDDGSTLYIAADRYLCKVKTLTKGAGK